MKCSKCKYWKKKESGDIGICNQICKEVEIDVWLEVPTEWTVDTEPNFYCAGFKKK